MILATSQCESAPLDADAHGITLALLLSARRKSNSTIDRDQLIIQRCSSFLKCSSGGHGASANGQLSYSLVVASQSF